MLSSIASLEKSSTERLKGRHLGGHQDLLLDLGFSDWCPADTARSYMGQRRDKVRTNDKIFFLLKKGSLKSYYNSNQVLIY